MLPRLLRKHTYQLSDGLSTSTNLWRLWNFYVKDARGSYITCWMIFEDYYIDEVSSMKHMDVFHSNARLSLRAFSTTTTRFLYHLRRVSSCDYAIEHLTKPIPLYWSSRKKRPLYPTTPFYAISANNTPIQQTCRKHVPTRLNETRFTCSMIFWKKHYITMDKFLNWT